MDGTNVKSASSCTLSVIGISDEISTNNSSVENDTRITSNSSSLNPRTMLFNFDVGTIDTEFFAPKQVDAATRRGHMKMPLVFPRDINNEHFPTSLITKILPNGE